MIEPRSHWPVKSLVLGILTLTSSWDNPLCLKGMNRLLFFNHPLQCVSLTQRTWDNATFVSVWFFGVHLLLWMLKALWRDCLVSVLCYWSCKLRIHKPNLPYISDPFSIVHAQSDHVSLIFFLIVEKTCSHFVITLGCVTQIRPSGTASFHGAEGANKKTSFPETNRVKERYNAEDSPKLKSDDWKKIQPF